MKTLLLATAIILAPVGVACAADIGETAPAGYNWSGLYAGVGVGYAAGKSNLFIAGGGLGGASDLNASVDPDGSIGGVHIGANYQMESQFVIGAEADIAYSNIDGLTPIAAGGGGVNTLLKSELKWSGSARLRAGYAFDRTLPYITAGVAAAKYELIAVSTGGAAGEITLHDESQCRLDLGRRHRARLHRQMDRAGRISLFRLRQPATLGSRWLSNGNESRSPDARYPGWAQLQILIGRINKPWRRAPGFCLCRPADAKRPHRRGKYHGAFQDNSGAAQPKTLPANNAKRVARAVDPSGVFSGRDTASFGGGKQ